GRGDQPADHLDDRCLARAVRAEQADHLPWLDSQAHVVDREDRRVASPIALCQTFELNCPAIALGRLTVIAGTGRIDTDRGHHAAVSWVRMASIRQTVLSAGRDGHEHWCRRNMRKSPSGLCRKHST